MALNIDKLTYLNRHPDGKTTARCPACAESGGDTKGEHLVIFPSGCFGCVAHPGDKTHRQRIFKLAGDRATSPGPSQVRINIKMKRPM